MPFYYVFVNRPAGQYARKYRTHRSAQRYARWVISRFGLSRSHLSYGWWPPSWYHNQTGKPNNLVSYGNKNVSVWVDSMLRPAGTFFSRSHK